MESMVNENILYSIMHKFNNYLIKNSQAVKKGVRPLDRLW